MGSLVALIVYLVCIFATCESANTTLKVCALIPVTPGEYSTMGREWMEVAKAAAYDINTNNSIPGRQLEMVILDTLDTEAGTANASLQVPAQNCLGTIDTNVGQFSEIAQYILQNYKIPQISVIAADALLSDKQLFPTFFRVNPSHAAGGPTIAYLINQFGWKKVAIISTMDPYGLSYYQSFKEAVVPMGIDITVECFIGSINPDYVGQVKKLVEAYTAIIVVFALVPDMEQILLAAYGQQILKSPFVWIGPSAMVNFNQSVLPKGALKGCLCVTPSSISNTTLAEQFNRWNFTHHHSGFVYDTVYTYAQAFKTAKSWEDPQTLLQTLLATNFTGVSGSIRFDKNGDRLGYTYEVRNWQGDGESKLVAYVSARGTVTMQQTIVWSNGLNNIPGDSIIKMVPIPVEIKYTLTVLIALLLLANLILCAVYIKSSMESNDSIDQNDTNEIQPNYAKKGLLTAGNVLGYIGIVLMLYVGATATTCIVIPMLLDLSFLMCGGTLWFVIIQNYAKNLQEHEVFNVQYRKFSIYFCWIFLVLCNLVALGGVFTIQEPPVVKDEQLKNDEWEHRCEFKLSFITLTLPISLGFMYVFALLMKLNSAFGSRRYTMTNVDKWDTLTMLFTFLALVCGFAYMVLPFSQRSTQVVTSIIICIAVIISGLSAPAEVLAWIQVLRRSRENGSYTQLLDIREK